MDWQQKEAKLKQEADAMSAALAGRKVTAAKFMTAYPGHFSTVRIEFDDGSVLEVNEAHGGCNECDPEGIGWGVNVDHVKGTR